MVRDYLVYGFDEKGNRHEVCRTASARKARTIRNAGNSPFARTIVYGADGEMTIAELNQRADLEENLA